jgi:hypothetical protein
MKMIVETLAIILVSISLVSAYVSGSEQERQVTNQGLALSLIPLCVSLFLFLFPETMTLESYGDESGQAVSIPLKYSTNVDTLNPVSPTYEAEIKVPQVEDLHLFGQKFQFALILACLSLALILSLWKKQRWLSLSISALQILLIFVAYQDLPFRLDQSYQGEIAVRDFLKMDVVDSKNLLQFALPSESWHFQFKSLSILIYTLLIVVLIHLSQWFSLNWLSFKSLQWIQGICSIVLMVSIMYQQFQKIGLSQHLPLFFSLFLLMISWKTARKSTEVLLLSSVALLSLVL